jgi:hypothetical protein
VSEGPRGRQEGAEQVRAAGLSEGADLKIIGSRMAGFGSIFFAVCALRSFFAGASMEATGGEWGAGVVAPDGTRGSD